MEKPSDIPAVLNVGAIRNNISVLEYSRTVQSAVSGAVAGILGLTSFHGFAFYFLCALMQAVIWLVKAGGPSSVSNYFQSKTTVFDHSLLGGLFTYVLFWTFLYGMVHVY